MHENAPVLTAKRRERIGSRYSERIRKAGGLPAIVYGHGQEPMPIALDARDTLLHVRKGEKVYQIQLDGESAAQVVLLKDLQFDHLGTNVVHADFARVDLDERVRVRVPIHLIGEAIGLKTSGAVLIHPTSEIEIECRVANLPGHLEVDVSGLEAGHVLHASDIALPLPTMKLVTEPGSIVAQIIVHALIETAEETAVAAGAQPEVITERKKDEEGA